MTTTPFAAFAPPVRPQAPLRRSITSAFRRPERDCVAALLEQAALPSDVTARAQATATALVTALRAKPRGSGVEGLVHEFALSSQEGVALMCLAEALLRIPDAATRDALIRDKIAPGDWKAHVGDGRSLFVNAATWGLVVTGKLTASVNDSGLSAALTRLIARAGEPVIRRAVDMAMRLMGEQFVTGETIAEALKRSRGPEAKGYQYSYDMLGEAATTAEDAARYYKDYERAIHAIGQASAGRGVYAGPGISVKLSALHPRYTRAQVGRVMDELLPRLSELAALAKGYGIGFNIDAEEADRLEISLDLLESLANDPALAGWDGLGFVVQAYGKRCPFVIDWIVDLARRSGRRIMVRLVKGAYWDAEIKRAQVDGLTDFPVFTRKVHTDVSYLACAARLLTARDAVFPQFATHNAQTLATIHALAGPDFTVGDYEFQCLHGMGEPLYDEVVGTDKLGRPCRIYAPVGTHETLLAYLVRRLLENGANSSFVNRIGDPAVPIAELVADPVAEVRAMPDPGAPHPAIALPADLYPGRRNSRGLDLADESVLADVSERLQASAGRDWHAGGEDTGGGRAVLNPADHGDRVGTVVEVTTKQAAAMAAAARAAAPAWAATAVDARAACLERAADLLDARMEDLLGLIMREAGKSLPNAIAEVREALDFLRYYALQARATMTDQAPLGVVTCISPWNFPLAIFTGQVAAALVTGNAVLAKPAEETPLIAAQAVAILHEAGVPRDVLQLVPGDGAVGGALVAAAETGGVLFTGSTEVARIIQGELAKRLGAQGNPIPFIAETGGQNAMIVDSSALAEQVVADVLASAFDSAGQRCSALRILCLQDDIADRTLAMLRGALAELSVGRTDRLAVDIGPVITADAQAGIARHIEAMRAKGCRVTQVALPPEAGAGTFIAPTIIEIDRVDQLEREVFGPVLHVMRFRRSGLDALIDAINATGYGLTFGLHTRLDETIAHVTGRVRAGNVYVNRNVIGAVVGVQPFGGRGLSGTGPKAGGPLYLGRLVHAPLVAPASCRPGTVTELPGPVGERNLYALHPRGDILLLARSDKGLAAQLAAVEATGNRAVVFAPHLQIAGLPVFARRVDDPAAAGPYAGALVEGDAVVLRRQLPRIAALPGPIVLTQAGKPRLDWLVEEVSTSINTTAAGGNASLMAMV
ncbi:bifunctional proline dehydrogenase/L-glutamate gamma-semialdehyde dehydrogenase PutA [Parablastomonas sp. CN1-191]|uniref:bifunctional proline dehydrogenase/L-glutamate gamma-semialdehyde dehydrogenase PutA n=1 Tax=Parablastomonas sp. CN1-191 TaxID=3400908 RepID=UPI003BF7978E